MATSSRRIPKIDNDFIQGPIRSSAKESPTRFSGDHWGSVMDPDFWFATDEGVMINKSMAKRHPEYIKYKGGPREPTFSPDALPYEIYYSDAKKGTARGPGKSKDPYKKRPIKQDSKKFLRDMKLTPLP